MYWEGNDKDVCVFISSPMREGSTFLVITGVKFFQTELKNSQEISAQITLGSEKTNYKHG